MPIPPKPGPATPRRATLPAIQLRTDEPRLKVFLSEADAVKVLRNTPKAELYDAFGRPLTVVDAEKNFWMLQPTGDGDPDGLRTRILDILRDAAQREKPGGPDALEAEALIKWLEDAPSFRHFVFALGLARVKPLVHPRRSGRCVSCSWIQKLFQRSPPCCP